MADIKQLKVTFPTRDLINLTKQAQLALADEMREILQVVGESLLSKVRQAYVDKGRGGTGEDGIAWRPIQLGTLLARQRRAGRLTATGKKNKKGQGVASTGRIIGPVKDKKGSTKDALKKRISPSSGGYQIGVDTGLQLDTLQNGKTAAPRATGPSLKFEPTAVTVAAATKYAKHFDQQRPIMPDSMPIAWLAELEKLVAEHGAKVMETVVRP